MPLISRSLLRQEFAKAASVSRSASATLKSLSEARLDQTYDVFLSHSFLDAQDVLSLKRLIESREELSVYVDWVDDAELDRERVDKKTAERLKKRLEHCRSLLYATSRNAVTSKWMPWECGYFDGKRGRVAICPVVLEESTQSKSDEYPGQEYLSLYPYVASERSTANRMRLWVQDSPTSFVSLSRWVNGENPMTPSRAPQA